MLYISLLIKSWLILSLEIITYHTCKCRKNLKWYDRLYMQNNFSIYTMAGYIAITEVISFLPLLYELLYFISLMVLISVAIIITKMSIVEYFRGLYLYTIDTNCRPKNCPIVRFMLLKSLFTLCIQCMIFVHMIIKWFTSEITLNYLEFYAYVALLI